MPLQEAKEGPPMGYVIGVTLHQTVGEGCHSGTAVTGLASGMGRSEISHTRYAVSQQSAACEFSPILL
jgi:hypothetical protein